MQQGRQLRERVMNNNSPTPSSLTISTTNTASATSNKNKIMSSMSNRTSSPYASGDDSDPQDEVVSLLLSTLPKRSAVNNNDDDDNKDKKVRNLSPLSNSSKMTVDSIHRRIRFRWLLLSSCTRCIFSLIGLVLCINLLIGTIDILFRQYELKFPLNDNHYRYDNYNDIIISKKINITAEQQHSSSLVKPLSFSVVINTYKRPDKLRKSVQHYADECGRRTGIAYVNVIWAEEDVEPPSPESFFESDSNVRDGRKNDNRNNRSYVNIVRVPNSLNSRFLPFTVPDDSSSTTILSSAIFMTDDDLRVDCFSLQKAFEAWQGSPYSMVGFYPRLTLKPRRSKNKDDDWMTIYHLWPMVWWKQQMNMILTKACFFHERYMEIYATKQPQAVKDIVDDTHNCDDFSMAILVMNVTRADHAEQIKNDNNNNNNNMYSKNNNKPVPARPIYVQAKSITDEGLFGGISTGSGHFKKREPCLHDMSRIYQQHGWELPIQETFNLYESSYLHHKPGFWWQSHPSNFFEWFALHNLFD